MQSQLRLAPDQHTARFDSRTKHMLRDFDVTKMPLNEIRPAPTAMPEDPSRPPSSARAPGSAPMEVDLDNDDEARALGLSPVKPIGDGISNGKKITRAKKRTQEEIARDDYIKAEDELQNLLKLIPTMLAGKTFGLEVGKVDRSIAKKIRDATDNHHFDHLESLKKLANNVSLVRVASKHTKTLLAGGTGAKKVAKDFQASMENLQASFPDATCLI